MPGVERGRNLNVLTATRYDRACSLALPVRNCGMCVIEAIYQQRSRLSAFIPSLGVPIFHAVENEEDRLSPKPSPKKMLNSSAANEAAIPLIKSRTCASAVLTRSRSLIFPYLRPSSIKRKCATSQVRLDTPKMMARRRQKAMAKVAKRIPFPKYPQDLYLTPAFHSWFCSFWLLSVLVKKERTLLPFASPSLSRRGSAS